MKKDHVKIAHIYYDESTGKYNIQSCEEHLAGTMEFAYNFGKKIGFQDWTALIAQLHDVGKYSLKFQQYIRYKSGYDEGCQQLCKTDHSSAGAIISRKMYPQFFLPIAHCIAGHHSGLLNHASLCDRLEKNIDEEIPLPLTTINLTRPQNVNSKNLHHWFRMLYSCLVDADYLDTERFMNSTSYRLRTNSTNMVAIKEKLDSYLSNLSNLTSDTLLNNTRNKIQDECKNAAKLEEGIYSLTVPTGGGKTLSSMVWAVNHAIYHGKERIIVAIPYTSIIVQTAEIFRKIFGEENVLEHHSNFEGTGNQKLAAENWDAPIVVTTNVQLFESLFSNKSSKCRKLHNLCDSVLILDEVQMLPTTLLEPILDSLKALCTLFKTSILFTTASQPSYIGHIGSSKTRFEGIEKIHEIVDDISMLSKDLRRVSITIRQEEQRYEDIAKEIQLQEKILCIVNTRKEAKAIYEYMPNDGSTIHLSRMMCSAHIIETIDKIKKHLKSKSEVPLRVIATQLIEAGVDIDFPIVYRSIAGLDSILQAAGRCNREGLLNKLGQVIVFKGEERTPQGLISKGKYALEELLASEPMIDLLSPLAMKRYFSLLYSKINTFDEARIKELLCQSTSMQFEDAAKAFKMIDDDNHPIIVHWGKGSEYINKLKTHGLDRDLSRKLQKYSVSVRSKDLIELVKMGRIEQINEVWIQVDPNLYDLNVGLVMDNKWLNETYIL
ncbi:MAG: CRISPR-associated helicase Cas3' [Bacteroides graminisolvens]|nr:CRISPR-associated helicase Cas3' [Bacteroides graminisolvens]